MPVNEENISSLTNLMAPCEDSISQLEKLEHVIFNRPFIEAVYALRNIHDRNIYRRTHNNFGQYCIERLKMKRAHAYRLIKAAAIIDNLT